MTGLEQRVTAELSVEGISWLEQRLEHTGGVAKEFLLLELAMQEDLQGKEPKDRGRLSPMMNQLALTINRHGLTKRVFNFFFTYDIIGSLTHEDQETYCLLYKNGLTPEVITRRNAYYFGLPQGALNMSWAIMSGSLLRKITSADALSAVWEIGYFLFTATGFFYNFYRLHHARETGRGTEAIGPAPLFYNAHTYYTRSPLPQQYHKARAQVKEIGTTIRETLAHFTSSGRRES